MEASLREKLNNDLKQALRDGDKVKLGTIRMVIAAANNAESAKKVKLLTIAANKAGITDMNKQELSAADIAEAAKQAKLDDNDMLSIFAREIKQRHESIDAYKAGNRPTW